MTAPSADNVFPVVVIGSGLAGLTAAIHLAERDIPPLVLEADSEWPGGRLSGGAPNTFAYKGRTWSFPTEHGSHALWGGYDNMRAVLDRFLDVTLQDTGGEEWINRWGARVQSVEAGRAVYKSWLPAPFHYLQLLFKPGFWSTITPLDFLSLPGFLTSILLTLGFDPLAESVRLDGLLMQDYYRGWTPNLRAAFTGLGRNLLAASSDKITLAGFIAAIRFYTMLRRDSWKLQYLEGNAHDYLVKPLIDQIKQRGGMVMLGTRAISLQRLDTGWQIRVEDARLGGVRALEAEHVILAVEPAAAQAILCDSADTATQAAQIKFPPVLRNATARLWFDAAPRPGAPCGMFTGDFALDNFFWLHRLQAEFKEWHVVTGGSAIEAHLYATDDVLDQSDAVLTILATSEVQQAFPNLRGHFVYGAIRRNGLTQTQFIIPTKDSLHVETPWPGILACGDWIAYPTPSFWMERCCITGIAAANHVLQAHQAEPFPIIPPRPPEPLARIIGGAVRAGRRLVTPIIRLARGRR